MSLAVQIRQAAWRVVEKHVPAVRRWGTERREAFYLEIGRAVREAVIAHFVGDA